MLGLLAIDGSKGGYNILLDDVTLIEVLMKTHLWLMPCTRKLSDLIRGSDIYAVARVGKQTKRGCSLSQNQF